MRAAHTHTHTSAANEARKTNTKRKPKQIVQDHCCSSGSAGWSLCCAGIFIAPFAVSHSHSRHRIIAHESTRTCRPPKTFQYVRSLADGLVRDSGRTVDARTASHAHLKAAPDANATRHRPQHIKLPSCIAQPRPDTIHSNLLPLACRCRRRRACAPVNDCLRQRELGSVSLPIHWRRSRERGQRIRVGVAVSLGCR